MQGDRDYWKRVLANIEFVRAFAEGKDVQSFESLVFGKWSSHSEIDFVLHPSFYRIKPEPREVWVAIDRSLDMIGFTAAQAAQKNYGHRGELPDC